MWDQAEHEASDYLGRMTDQLAAQEPGLNVRALARIGPLTSLIRELDSAAETPIGLIVMATHHRSGLERVILGSEADAVLRADDIPLVLVRPDGTASESPEDIAMAAPGVR
jgi:hypothetical protein